MKKSYSMHKNNSINYKMETNQSIFARAWSKLKSICLLSWNFFKSCLLSFKAGFMFGIIATGGFDFAYKYGALMIRKSRKSKWVSLKFNKFKIVQRAVFASICTAWIIFISSLSRSFMARCLASGIMPLKASDTILI